MHSFTTHESRNLKQARPNGQYVDLLRYTLATPSWDYVIIILTFSTFPVKSYFFSKSFITITTTGNKTPAMGQIRPQVLYAFPVKQRHKKIAVTTSQ